MVAVGAAAFLAGAEGDGAAFGGNEDAFRGGSEGVGGYAGGMRGQYTLIWMEKMKVRTDDGR